VYNGVFASYRRGKRTQRNKQILIRIEGIHNDNEAARFIGKRVVWKSTTGNRIDGKIVGIHERRGLIKATFRKGLPGHALGSKIIVK